MPGHDAVVWYLLGTNVNTPFLPTVEFGHGAGTRVQWWALGLRVQTVFASSGAVHYFELAAKFMF